ncbi:CPBP family intramembrane glutamic endopeptidase [Clostridium lundense]|uniref:CPBP family intramembrane glutamic endopeptidase n=1 Tax=Clostridium lundense TaxID=319475 RepID=UPI00048190FD|nr:CPBP family intramembrane glutamic endopeptidase [Clostridium lundense]
MQINRNTFSSKSNGKKSAYMISLVTFMIFILSYILSIKVTQTKNDGMFMYRAWMWTEYIIGIASFVVIAAKFRDIKAEFIFPAIVLTFISSISLLNRSDIGTTIKEAVILFCSFIAACLLSKGNNNIKSSLVESKFKKAILSLVLGALISMPLAIINFFYFKNTTGYLNWQNPITSAFLALQPGIAEEIVFRFFIMNVFITILSKHVDKKHTIAISMFLGVVPHSLCHFSQLWIVNPISAIVMLMLTSLLFGLPMAYLQYKRDLETAISFHWCIDFIRFLGGF